MGRFAGRVYHPKGHGCEQVVSAGFSWPCFFCGFLWFAVKGVWTWAFISFVLAVLTSGISWVVFPFFANDLHQRHLIRKGYRFI